MSRPSPKNKSQARKGGLHQGRELGAYGGGGGDDVSGNPGAPNISISGTGLTKGGPRSIKGPGVNAKVGGKVKGMSGGKK